MTYLPENDPRVVAALERIEALRELTRTTGVRTTRTVNDLLASLPGGVLMTVAVELKRKDMNRHDNDNR